MTKHLRIAVALMLTVVATASQAQYQFKQLVGQGGNTPQIVIDGQGRFYFSSTSPTGTGNQGSRSLIRWNRPVNTFDTLATMRDPIAGLALSNLDTTLYFTASDTIWKLPTSAARGTRPVRFYAGFEYPTLLLMQNSTNRLYALEVGGDNGRAAAITWFDPATGARTKVCGGQRGTFPENGYINDTGTKARFGFPRPNGSRREFCALVFNAAGDTLFVGDQNNRCIRKVYIPPAATANSGIVRTHAGPLPDTVRSGYRDGYRQRARFDRISGLVFEREGGLIVTDQGPFNDDPDVGNRLRRVLPGGLVTTVAGSGIGQGRGNYNNLDFEPGRPGRTALLGFLSAIAKSANQDTLFIALGQRIVAAWKTPTPVAFVNLRNQVVGADTVPIQTASRAVVAVQLVSGPANVSFVLPPRGPAVVIPSTADTGVVFIIAAAAGSDTTEQNIIEGRFRVISPVAVRGSLIKGLQVYPIPASTNVTLRFGEGLPAKEMKATWIDALGRQLGTATIMQASTALNVPQGTGIIWLRVTAPGQPVQSIPVLRQ